MRTKSPPPAELLKGREPSALVELYFELCQLKQLFRQGWLRRGVTIEHCESVAEHSFAVAVLALAVAEAHFPELDQARVLRMALLHDFGEIDVGDLMPSDGVEPEAKRDRERLAVARVFRRHPRGDTYVALWDELERGETAEARLVRQVDKLEMALQASVYEHQGLAELGEFFESVDKALSAPELRSILAELERLRGAPEVES